MANLTQLGISGNPDKKPETKPQGKASPNQSPQGQGQRPSPNQKKLTNKQKTAALVGSAIVTMLLAVFLLESGCSKGSDKAAIAMPNQTVVSPPLVPISSATVATSTPAVAQPPAKKKSRQRKLSVAAYNNPDYGLSFRYPKYGSLKEGDDANVELDGLGTLDMNFVQEGGTTISAVELPRKLYAGTDFNAAFFNVSVNPKLTAEECEQFAFPLTLDPETDSVPTSKTKVGVTEFQTVEGFAGEEDNQADVKYYHVFQNGSCYEFALGLETAEQTSDETMPAVKPVNRNEVFRKLNWILSTVKIQPVDTPEKTIPEVATGTPTTPTESNNQ